MFAATRALLANAFRGNMSSKRGNRLFYKGRGAPTMGRFANSGRFLIDPKKFADNTFVCPPLEGFELKAYVALSSPRVRAATQATR